MRLINLDSGQYEEVDPFEVEDRVRSGSYSFDANDEVSFISPEGKLAKTDGQTALELLANPTSGYSFTTEEQYRADQRDEKFNTFGEEIKTAAEGLARGATVGLSDMVGDPEAKKARKEVNPIISTVSEIVGALAPLPTKALAPLKIIGAPTRAIDRVGRAAQAATTSALKGVSKPLARAGGLTARGAAEGALFGVGQTVSEDALGDADFNGEALVSNIAKGAFFGAGAGAVFGIGSEAVRKRAMLAKQDSANEIRKAFGVPTVKTGETLASFEKVDLPNVSTKKLVQFTPNDSGRYVHIGKGKTVEVDPDSFEGRIFNLYDPEVQSEIAGKLGVSDIAEKINDYDLEEGIVPFLESAMLDTQKAAQGQALARTKAQQVKLDSIKSKMSRQLSGMKRLQADVLDLQTRLSSGDFSVKKTLQKKQGKLGEQKKAYRKSVGEWGEFKNMAVGKTEARNIQKDVADFIESFDMIQSGKKIYIQNDDILSNAGIDVLNHATREAKDLNFSEKAILRLIGAKSTDILKARPQQLKNLVKYTQDILGKGKISRRNLMGVDEIAETNSAILENAVNQQEEVINGMTNYFKDQNLDIGINAKTLKASLANMSKRLTDGFDKPKIGMSDAVAQVNDFRNEIERAFTEEAIDGARRIQGLSIRDVVELRRAVQDKINWNRTPTNVNKNAEAEKVFNEFRVYLNDLIIDKASKIQATKDLSVAYKDLNQTMTNAILLDRIVKKTMAQESVRKSVSLADMFTGTVGLSVGSAPIALASLTAKRFYDAFGNNILGVYGDSVARRAEQLSKAIRSSASGFMGTSRVSVVRPATMGLYTLTDYEKDKKKIENGALSPEALNGSFLEANSSAISLLPKTTYAIQESIVRGNQLLLEKFPKGSGDLTNSYTPSQAALDKFDKYKRAIQNPEVALGEFKLGYMTPESLEVMKVVYPKIFRTLKAETIDQMAGKKLNYQQRQQLFRVFGIKSNLYQGLQANQFLNKALEQEQNNEMTQGQQSRAGKSKRPEEMQTASQRLMDSN